jgi:hypothetical protein
MVNDGAVERLCRRGQPARSPAIAVARPGIAARVIMGKDYACAAMCGCIGNDLPQRKAGARLVPFVAGHMEATSLVIDVSDPQALAARIEFGEAAREELASGGDPIELQREFGTLIPHGN